MKNVQWLEGEGGPHLVLPREALAAVEGKRRSRPQQ
jgi:hypothetical protein